MDAVHFRKFYQMFADRIRMTCFSLQSDEARAELPLTPDKRETFPVGFCLETGSTNQLMIGEIRVPVMPMVHIYSTHGYLLSFNLLNLQPTYVDICSPPRPISDRSAANLFAELPAASKTPTKAPAPAQPQPQVQPKTQEVAKASSGEHANLTFVIPENSTSTPAKTSLGFSGQPKSLFGGAQAPHPSAATSLFGGKPANGFGSSNLPAKPANFSSPTFGSPAATPANNIVPKPAQAPPAKTSEPAKPLYTVDPNYTPASAGAQATKASGKSNSALKSDVESALLAELIRDQLQSLEDLVKNSLERSKKVNTEVCSKEEMSALMKNVDKLQEVTTQAVDSTESLSSEVQSLRLTLYEAFAMSAEVQSKIDWLNK